MEFIEVIILAALTVIFLLQIIFLINQHKISKVIKEIIIQKERAFQFDRDRHDRKDNGFHQQRLKQHDVRPKQQLASSVSSSPGSVESVEKSLRDINLKLKNAERDQEAARRRIKENLGKEHHSRRRHHKDNNRRGGGGGGPRDNNRDNRRDVHREQGNKENQNQSDQQPASLEPTVAVTTVSTDVSVEPKVSALPDLNPVDYDNDKTEHGRKFMVKRRFLDEEPQLDSVSGQGEIGPAETITPSVMSDSSVSTSDTNPQPDRRGDAEISFGRR